ncbi:hypothetical protein [Streptomyces sasae]
MRFDAVESETELGFAALHQLLRPHLVQLPEVPDPQSEALRQVFGLQERTSPPDRFLVALASLGLVAARADDRPLLCLVDDAHWLDEESAAVLDFVARRLHADAITMVFAARDHLDRVDHLAGLPELPVTGLGADAAGRLLESVVSGVLDPDVRDRIIASTAQRRRRTDPPGGPGRPARRRRRHQRGDRRPALPQCAHGRLPPAQGLPEARRPLPARAGRPPRPHHVGVGPGNGPCHVVATTADYGLYGMT